MFKHEKAEFLQANPKSGLPFKIKHPESVIWSVELEVFTDGHGNNVANIAVFHPKLKRGYMARNDIAFRDAEHLNWYVDQLMQRASELAKRDTFDWGNVQKAVLHESVRRFLRGLC